MSTEDNRWFHIEQDRKREQAARVRRAQKRAYRLREAKKRAARDYRYPDHNSTITEWEIDEFGNLSRKVIGT